MPSTIVIDAFGQLTPDPHQSFIVVEDEDLYSVFRERSELMSWSTDTTLPPVRERLWSLEEAEELSDVNNTGRIGWVQVGLPGSGIKSSDQLPMQASGFASLGESQDNIVDPARIIPALSQCFIDSLSRFGIITLTGLQVTVSHPIFYVQAKSNLVSVLNWFNLTPLSRTNAIIAFDHELLTTCTIDGVFRQLQESNTGPFIFSSIVTVSTLHEIQVIFEPLAPANVGIAVALPEWTASAIGWVLAMVLDTVRALAPDIENGAIRLTRK